MFQCLTTNKTFETLRFMPSSTQTTSVQAAIAENYDSLSEALKAALKTTNSCAIRRAMNWPTVPINSPSKPSSCIKTPSFRFFGSLSSASFTDYFSYLTSWFDDRWSVAGRNGLTLASTLTRLTKNDVVIVISKAPYAKRAVLATRMAAERGATIIVLTDSHTFPAIKHAKHVFIHKTESPQFFVSYASTLVLIETLTGMLLARAGKKAITDIESLVAQNQLLDEISLVS